MSAVLVERVEAKGDKAAILVMSDKSRIWTPEKTKADALAGKPIPPDWTRKDGPYGPQALPPRDKSAPQAAFRNTKEGFLAEQEGYYRKDEAMDRRTALMQACALSVDGSAWKHKAEQMYAWLRETKASGVSDLVTNRPPTGETETPEEPSGEPPSGQARTTSPGVASPDRSDSAVVPESVSAPGPEATGKGQRSGCAHLNTTEYKPDGTTKLAEGRVRCIDCGLTLVMVP